MEIDIDILTKISLHVSLPTRCDQIALNQLFQTNARSAFLTADGLHTYSFIVPLRCVALFLVFIFTSTCQSLFVHGHLDIGLQGAFIKQGAKGFAVYNYRVCVGQLLGILVLKLLDSFSLTTYEQFLLLPLHPRAQLLSLRSDLLSYS